MKIKIELQGASEKFCFDENFKKKYDLYNSCRFFDPFAFSCKAFNVSIEGYQRCQQCLKNEK